MRNDRWIGLGLALLTTGVMSLAVWVSPSPAFEAPPQQANNVTLTLPTTPVAGSSMIAEALTVTVTTTPTVTITPTLTLTPGPNAFLPVIFKFDPPPTPTPTPTPTVTPTASPGITTRLICSEGALGIPDNSSSGTNSAVEINETGKIIDLDVYVHVNHTWVGDLAVTLRHEATGQQATLLYRPGYPGTSWGCEYNNIDTIFDDEVSVAAQTRCAPSPAAISGIYRPIDTLNRFIGESVSGRWILNTADLSINDFGTLESWCAEVTFGLDVPPPTPTPPPVSLPASAMIYGMQGKSQSLNLDCESRSAVDWAGYFGWTIGELDFLYNLPLSDNPDVGFVGNPNGALHQTPPNDYGVHAAPVAALLQQYGLNAEAVRPLSWDGLRYQIALGNPVIVWIVGTTDAYLKRGIPLYYTSAAGDVTVVARDEHTVNVVGYDASYVYILNGAPPYKYVPIDLFLDSWSVMRQMAVVKR